MPLKSLANKWKLAAVRRKTSVNSQPVAEQTQAVTYLGHVLTPSSECMETISQSLWSIEFNYKKRCNGADTDILLHVTSYGITGSVEIHDLMSFGLSKITSCGVSLSDSRVFYWIYRHLPRSGHRRIHEILRCHAVRCSKEKHATMMLDTLLYHMELSRARRSSTYLHRSFSVGDPPRPSRPSSTITVDESEIDNDKSGKKTVTFEPNVSYRHAVSESDSSLLSPLVLPDEGDNVSTLSDAFEDDSSPDNISLASADKLEMITSLNQRRQGRSHIWKADPCE